MGVGTGYGKLATKERMTTNSGKSEEWRHTSGLVAIRQQFHEEDVTCVEFRCVHRPHHRVDLPSRSYTEKEDTLVRRHPESFSAQRHEGESERGVLLEMSAFTRGV